MGNTAEAIKVNEIVERTIEARERRKLSQRDVAHQLDIPVEQYRRYEAVEAIPSNLLARFCMITGVDVIYMVRGSREPSSEPETPPPPSSERSATS